MIVQSRNKNCRPAVKTEKTRCGENFSAKRSFPEQPSVTGVECINTVIIRTGYYRIHSSDFSGADSVVDPVSRHFLPALFPGSGIDGYRECETHKNK